MAVSDAARDDLYTGLVDLLGPDRAGTLMAYLPKYDPTDLVASLATLDARMSAKFASIDARFASIDARFDAIDKRFDSMDRRFDSVDSSFGEVNRRIDRLYLTLIAGLFVIVAAMAGVFAAALS